MKAGWEYLVATERGGSLQEVKSLTDHLGPSASTHPPSLGELVYWRKLGETNPPKESAVPSRAYSDDGTVL